MRSVHQFVTTDESLAEVARAAQLAAIACREWENGGSSGPVGDTAEVALSAINHAFRNIRDVDGVALRDHDPETRQARLIVAGYMLLLAGTDEHGESGDLTLAASVFRRAAIT